MTSTPERILQIGAQRTGVSVEQLAEQLATTIEPTPARTPRPIARPSRQVARAGERQREKDARKKATAERLALAAAERRRRFDEESRRRGAPDFDPKDLPPAAFGIAGRVEAGSRGAERELTRMRRTAFGRAVEVAALGMTRREDGTRRATRTLGSLPARRVVAIAAVFLYLSESTSRNGYALLVEGYARGSFCALFRNRNRDGAPVCLSTLYATSIDKRRRAKWDCGAVVALVRAGAFEKHQPSAESMIKAGKRCNVGLGRDGKTPRALNQYWVCTLAVVGAPELAEQLAPTWHGVRARTPAQPRGP